MEKYIRCHVEEINAGQKIRVETDNGESAVGRLTEIFVAVCAERDNRPSVGITISDDDVDPIENNRTGKYGSMTFDMNRVRRIDVLEDPEDRMFGFAANIIP